MSIFFSALERLLDTLDHIENPGSSCSLNLPIGNTGVITCKDGSLLSVIEIRGCRRYVGLKEHRENVEALAEKLTPYYKSQQHDIGFFYEFDNDEDVVRKKLDEIYSPVQSAIRSLGLKFDSVLKEEKDVLAKVTHVETCWMVIWTNTKLRTQVPAEERVPVANAAEFRSSNYMDMNGITHHATRGSSHEAMVGGVMTVLKERDFSVVKLTSANIIRAIRNCIDARKTGQNWEPRMISNQKSAFAYLPDNPKDVVKEGVAGLMPPSLGRQVWPCEPRTVKGHPEVLQVGSRIYKVIVLKVQPNGPVPFEKLLKEASSLGISLRFSGLMKSAGSAMLGLKTMVAAATTVLPIPSRAKHLRDTTDHLKKYLDEKRKTDSAIQMAFTTWDHVDNIRELEFKADKLLQIINGWNQASAYFIVDDIQEGYVSTLPAYRNGSVAPAAVGPLEDILYCMPITRPVMPFNTGGMCFRSEDGRPMPFQPFDYNVLRHHIYLVAGEPGYGKSALINNLQVSLLSASNDIPYIGIADVGTSSLGAILMAQSILPEGKKHYAMYHRLRNTEEQSYNFLEQDYGLRSPLKEHFDEIVNHIELMMCDDRTGELHTDMPGLIRAVVRLAYRVRSDEGSKADPEYFKRNRMNDKHWPIISKALEQIGLKPNTDMTWWSIFDALHAEGFYREASLVMRFVAPTLPLLAAIATRPEIRSEYPGIYDSGTPLVDYFSRRIGELVEEYPIFSGHTQLDLGDSRIISLDLEEVVPRASEGDYSLKKKGAVFFATAARILTSRFFWKEDRLTDIPEKYHTYHEPRIRSIRQTTNALQIDELQRFAGIDQSDQLCIKIANEGRKWEIGVILASQDVIEMPKRLVSFSTARFICGFEAKSVGNVKEYFKLNDTEVELIVRKIRPPSKEGAWLLLQIDTDEESYSHLVNCRMGPQKLWGLSTRNKDAIVRSRVYKEFNDERGRALLAHLYPSGSIGDEYDFRVQSLSVDHDVGLMELDEINENTDIIQSIGDSIIKQGHEIFTKSLREEMA
ncbi:hypothetical protein [Neptuniibacter halophilus]|uniref:hypothetical protein n=1 Tax=Neptuniibacter halophilus TaxID=651666 RepID=UPI002573A5F5|nr:hypothetical protein [Neptuniibacter halophilus]